jgi:hypothetical protein
MYNFSLGWVTLNLILSLCQWEMNFHLSYSSLSTVVIQFLAQFIRMELPKTYWPNIPLQCNM